MTNVAASEVVMMPNGFVGCWLVKGPGSILTGMSEVASERVGREWAKKLGVPFRRINSWRHA